MWSLDAMKVKRRASCCLTHSGVKTFTHASVIVLLLLCSPYDYIPVLFNLKSAFFSLCLEPCINTEFCQITICQTVPLLIWFKHTLLLYYDSDVDKMLLMNSVNCAHTCPYWYCTVFWSTENISRHDDSETREHKSLWVSFRGIHFLPASFTVVGTK